ncbi:MAG TPA: hypothetical protein VII61_09825 [Ktedonobacteraceae bacterium]
MIQIPFHPRYTENMERHGMRNSLPCVICGKEVTAKNHKEVIMWSGMYLVTAQEVEEKGGIEHGAYMGNYPIGPDCLRQHPEIKPYVVKDK